MRACTSSPSFSPAPASAWRSGSSERAGRRSGRRCSALMGIPAPIALGVTASRRPARRDRGRAAVLPRRRARRPGRGAGGARGGADRRGRRAASQRRGGRGLLLASGVLLVVVGCAWSCRSAPEGDGRVPEGRQDRLVVASGAAAGLVAGLLATGGGIVLVPLFIVAFGFTAARAAGTSLVVAAALTVPTSPRTGCSATSTGRSRPRSRSGMVPASFAAARVGMKLPDRIVRPAFGAVSWPSRSTSWPFRSPDRE